MWRWARRLTRASYGMTLSFTLFVLSSPYTARRNKGLRRPWEPRLNISSTCRGGHEAGPAGDSQRPSVWRPRHQLSPCQMVVAAPRA